MIYYNSFGFTIKYNLCRKERQMKLKLHENIKKFRKEKNLTQEKLAESFKSGKNALFEAVTMCFDASAFFFAAKSPGLTAIASSNRFVNFRLYFFFFL